MAIPTDTHVLTLAQWFSPAFPVGAFSYSHGLEQAVAAGSVTDAPTLGGWIADALDHGAGRSDALFLAATYLGDDAGVQGIDARCRAFAPSRERLKETVDQGAAFCRTLGAVWGETPKALTYPVAVGCAARRLRLPMRLTAAMYLQAFASNLIGAGQRLTLLGQTAGQALLRDLGPLCIAIADQTGSGDLDDLCSTAFLIDIASMNHEDQYARIFQS